jgi:hypothetical protein
MTTQSMVVKAYRPWRYRITIALLLVLAVAAVAYAYQRGLNDGGYYHTEARAERESLQAELSRARETETELRDQVAVLQRAQEVDQAARENLRQDLIELQDEIQRLEEELAFYRGIVSPEDGQSGLQVQDFSVTPADGARLFDYRLMLIQALSHDRRVSGNATFVLVGRQDGEEARLALADVSDRATMAFSFRYFQGFEGRLNLPEGFQPEAVELTVNPNGRNRSALEERFEWPELED